MEKTNKTERRRLYNKQWIAEKRRKTSCTLRENEGEGLGSSDETCSFETQDVDTQNRYSSWEEDGSENSEVTCSTNEEQPEASQISPNADRSFCDEHSGTENSLLDSGTYHALALLSSDESEDDTENLKDSLREWANTYEVKANALDSLLKILKENGHHDIPVSARTLMKTPRSVNLLRVSNMDYYHFGLERMLCVNLAKCDEESLQTIDTLMLSLNIDGFPLFKSTQSSVWPVLGAVSNIKPLKPFPITVTVGKSKPSNLEFLDEAIRELNTLSTNGLDFKGKHYNVKVMCIICDAPARSFVKCTKQYSGYYGCDKCTQRGRYIGRMTFQEVNNLELRTDHSFRNKDQDEHHRGESPFLDLPIDMIKDFPVDYMHQLCLGVTRKLLLTWMRGTRGPTRLSDGQIGQISAKLLSLKECIPREFARKPRSLDEIDRWKATELRQFLLYTGQFALKQILPENLYKHFMCLNVAVSILINEHLVTLYANYAHRLLLYFVRKCSELYGEQFLVYNIHCLTHLKEEADKFGSLENCAAWPFENYMQYLKRKIRGGNNPAAQLVKRIIESIDVNKDTLKTTKIRYRHPDNIYLTENGKYCELIHPTNRDETSFVCRVFHTSEHSFTYPCNSDIIRQVRFRNVDYNVRTVEANKLVTRCLRIEDNNRVVFLPLLHDFHH